MKKAYLIEINPTVEQILKINQTIGVCRYVYNLYLSTNLEYYKKENKFMSGYDFSLWLNNTYTKDKDVWIKEVSSKSVKKSILNSEMAFKRFFKGVSKFPRYKNKKNQDVKAYFIKSSGKMEVVRHRVKVPTLGWIRFKEYGYAPEGFTGISCTIHKKVGRYYISILCEVENKNTQINTNNGIGVDLGIKEFASCSNGNVFKNINKTKEVKKIEKTLKRHQRCLSRKYEKLKTRGGKTGTKKNIYKQLLKIQRLHNRLLNIREEYIRYVVNTLVKSKPVYITIEDLNVRGMLKNRNLSKSIAQQKFYRFRELLLNKCRYTGIELRLVGRFYPSSKLCSSCGYKKLSLSLSEREYCCDNCDTVLDRDFNASLNLEYAKEYTILT